MYGSAFTPRGEPLETTGGGGGAKKFGQQVVQKSLFSPHIIKNACLVLEMTNNCFLRKKKNIVPRVDPMVRIISAPRHF